MSDLYSVIGTAAYKNLLADPNGADAIAIPCEPGNGDVPMGTVMYRKASGLFAPAATAQVTASNFLVVLGEDVATGSAPAAGVTVTAEDAKAFRTGCFINGAVFLASKAALSDANKVVLRGQGIVFDRETETTTFTNTVTGA